MCLARSLRPGAPAMARSTGARVRMRTAPGQDPARRSQAQAQLVQAGQQHQLPCLSAAPLGHARWRAVMTPRQRQQLLL